MDNVNDLFKCTEKKSTQGRPVKLTKELKLKVQEFWRKNSIISVDRRNLRNVVMIVSKNVKRVAADLLDDNDMVTKVKTKRGWKYEAERYISTRTFRYLYLKFISQNEDDSISFGTFFQVRPFYISPPRKKAVSASFFKYPLLV